MRKEKKKMGLIFFFLPNPVQIVRIFGSKIISFGLKPTLSLVKILYDRSQIRNLFSLSAA